MDQIYAEEQQKARKMRNTNKSVSFDLKSNRKQQKNKKTPQKKGRKNQNGKNNKQ